MGFLAYLQGRTCWFSGATKMAQAAPRTEQLPWSNRLSLSRLNGLERVSRPDGLVGDGVMMINSCFERFPI